MAGSREDTYSVTVSFDGEDTGVWDKMSGGLVDSNERKYKPGNLGEEISLGGTKTTENVSVSRNYDLERDHVGLVKRLMARTGIAEMRVKKQPLTKEGVPVGDPIVYNGTLKSTSPPDVDSESDEAGMLEIEVTVASVG
jgi:hypothetical protein